MTYMSQVKPRFSKRHTIHDVQPLANSYLLSISSSNFHSRWQQLRLRLAALLPWPLYKALQTSTSKKVSNALEAVGVSLQTISSVAASHTHQAAHAHLCKFVRHMHQLRCEWCQRYSHAQVTSECQAAPSHDHAALTLLQRRICNGKRIAMTGQVLCDTSIRC